MQEEPIPYDIKPRFDLDFVIYWSKLIMGLVFGFLSYMIMRLSDFTFFLIVPLLLITALIITLVIVIIYDRKYGAKLTHWKMFKRSLMYTGTYFLAFVALAILSFYWGA